MSAAVKPSLFFLGLPDLKKLVCVSLTLQQDEELRSKQIKTCRELVLLFSEVLASPALDSFAEVTAVMATTFFQRGILQAFGQRRGLQLGGPRRVSPGLLQCCLSYSLITRLAPSWNKAGLYLIAGKDFLSESRKLDAVSLELNASEGQLCISIDANAVRLPPTTLDDFDIPSLVLRRFCSDPDAVLDPSSTGRAVWCHVLPSMKKGQIITISRRLPRDGPFRTYRDLQNHWSCLYGYRLPDLVEHEVVYCSVFFRLLGEKLFTYPLSCLRLQPVQRCQRLHQQGAINCFLSDISERLQSVCGFPARLSGKPCYPTAGLDSAAQANLTSFSSISPAFTQHPPPPPPPLPLQPLRPSLVQQDRIQGILGNGCQFKSCLTQSQGCRGDRDQPSSLYCSSSSSVPLLQPASSLYSSSLLPPLPPPSAPKLVPIFKNKFPLRHVNVALLRVQKQKEQLGGEEVRRRVTLPAFRRKTPLSSSSSSFIAASLPPPPIVPRFRPHNSQPSSEASERSVSPKLEIRFKPKSCLKARSSSAAVQEEPWAAAPDASSRRGVVFESTPKTKKSRSAVRDVDVEEMARSNQLSKLNSATLLAWLRGRGANASAKNRKEELILKVMSRLAEA